MRDKCPVRIRTLWKSFYFTPDPDQRHINPHFSRSVGCASPRKNRTNIPFFSVEQLIHSTANEIKDWTTYPGGVLLYSLPSVLSAAAVSPFPLRGRRRDFVGETSSISVPLLSNLFMLHMHSADKMFLFSFLVNLLHMIDDVFCRPENSKKSLLTWWAAQGSRIRPVCRPTTCTKVDFRSMRYAVGTMRFWFRANVPSGLWFTSSLSRPNFKQQKDESTLQMRKSFVRPMHRQKN